ncbi:hypothetical protein BDQ17DRAFT_1422055 [Cyathus striatus]|nr:hypothetical protein BDQ17DRAFT_1422055 [Cyathus striatus]
MTTADVAGLYSSVSYLLLFDPPPIQSPPSSSLRHPSPAHILTDSIIQIPPRLQSLHLALSHSSPIPHLSLPPSPPLPLLPSYLSPCLGALFITRLGQFQTPPGRGLSILPFSFTFSPCFTAAVFKFFSLISHHSVNFENFPPHLHPAYFLL